MGTLSLFFFFLTIKLSFLTSLMKKLISSSKTTKFCSYSWPRSFSSTTLDELNNLLLTSRKRSFFSVIRFISKGDGVVFSDIIVIILDKCIILMALNRLPNWDLILAFILLTDFLIWA